MSTRSKQTQAGVKVSKVGTMTGQEQTDPERPEEAKQADTETVTNIILWALLAHWSHMWSKDQAGLSHQPPRVLFPSSCEPSRTAPGNVERSVSKLKLGPSKFL